MATRIAGWLGVASARRARAASGTRAKRGGPGLARVGTPWLVLALLAAGCGTSAPSRFYTLDSVATPDGSPRASYGVMVGPVSVPSAVDRAEFVVQVKPNQVAIDEFNRWAAPLSESVARTVAGDLAVLLGTPDVAVAPFANFEPDYRVTINLQRFDSGPGQAVRVEGVWTVRQVQGGETRSGRTLARETASGPGFDALAAAHSQALAKLSADIAAAIRALAAAGSESAEPSG